MSAKSPRNSASNRTGNREQASDDVVCPAPIDGDEVVQKFVRRVVVAAPFSSTLGVSWFGFRSLWGHLRHFVASAIATDDVDSRDWMEPDPPEDLERRIAQVLGRKGTGTLTTSLGRDVWIDYVADTGDDAKVSQAVGRLIFQPYRLPELQDSDDATASSSAASKGASGATSKAAGKAASKDESHVLAPRGDVLIFGGDTAYPVATSKEILDRVVVPFNRVLSRLDGSTDSDAHGGASDDDNSQRVLLGIPGNHDWYDGLDGFGRFFRRRDHQKAAPTESSPGTPVGRAVEFVDKFVRGSRRSKPKDLTLRGYRAVQNASYFGFRLAPGLDLMAVDRQLKNIDYRQRRYFRHFEAKSESHSELPATEPEAPASEAEGPPHHKVILLPNPLFAFGKAEPSGMEMAQDLDLDTEHNAHLLVSGDIHHYRREYVGRATQVTAGGGGAFLHPAPIARGDDVNAAEVEWPGAKASRRILTQAPLQIGAGRAGFIPHVVMLLLFAPLMGIGNFTLGHGGIVPASIAIGLAAWISYLFVGGAPKREKPGAVAGLSAIAAILTGAAPVVATPLLQRVLDFVWVGAPDWVCAVAALFAAVAAGGLVFGFYLTALTAFGLEQMQAFTAISHAGFKHFLRLRVREDGSAVDVWCIGLPDPLAKDGAPRLVDAFTWRR